MIHIFTICIMGAGLFALAVMIRELAIALQEDDQ